MTKTCKACGGQVSKSAKACPHCGHRKRGFFSGCLPALVILIIAALLFGFILSAGLAWL